MRKVVLLLYILCIVLTTNVTAQRNRIVDSLTQLHTVATSDTAKVNALNKLANYYYRSQLIREADSISAKQLLIAELSNNKELVLNTYFDNSAASIVEWSTTGDFNRVIRFIQKGIDYAKRINELNYIVLGQTRLAAVLRKRGKYNEALDASVSALNYIQDVSDSIKAIIYIEIGNYYRSKKEFPAASANYNNAFEIAIKKKNKHIESSIYRCLAGLHQDLEEVNDAKDFWLRSLQLDKTLNNSEGIVMDYIGMGKLEGEDFYIQQAITIADSLQFVDYKLKAMETRLAIHMQKKESDKAFILLDSEPELRNYFNRGGIENYYYERGTIHLWTGKPDSALYYFGKVESHMMQNYDIKVGSNIYLDMGDCHYFKGDLAKAIEYYLKALSYFRQAGEAISIIGCSDALSGFYKEAGDFKNAFEYKALTAHIKDSISDLTKTKEVALLNQERLRKQSSEEQRQIDLAKTRRHNIQYMSITIAICAVFIGIMVLGMFPMSRFAIRLLGYFFFISVFEFIILVLDNNILHSITHGEPLKLWLIKIGLIGALVPLQHFLEHRITHFLASKRLLKAREKFSFKNLWAKKKIRRSPAKRSTKEAAKENPTAE